MAQETIFTKIINGEIPCHKVYEDEQLFAFLDIMPINPGHTLLVPKKQIDHFFDLEKKLYTHLMDTAYDLAQKIKTAFEPERVGLMVQGFEIPHAHLHLIPLHSAADIGSKKSYDGTRQQATPEDLKAAADKILEIS